MPHSHIELWAHLIWATKERNPWLKKEFRFKIIKHIRNKANEKDYHIDVVNGIEDHLHALVAFKANHKVSRIINDIKGESSHWINERDILQLDFNFHWQGGYAGFWVSPSAVNSIRNYILNQEKHHQTISMDEELKSLKASKKRNKW